MRQSVVAVLVSTLFAVPVYSQDQKAFSPQTFASVRVGFFRESTEAVNDRYGGMPGVVFSVFRDYSESFKIGGGVAIVYDKASFEYPELDIKGSSEITYIMLEGMGYYQKLFENNKAWQWYVGAGLAFAQIRQKGVIEDYSDSMSDQALGLKLCYGVECREGYFKDCFGQFSITSSAGDVDMKLAGLEAGFKWDISNAGQ